MIVTLRDDQMLRKWRLGALLEPTAPGLTVSRFDAVDVDGVLRGAMRAWYLRLLAEGDPTLVPVTDGTDRVTLDALAPGVWRVNLTPDVARLYDLWLSGVATPSRMLDAVCPDHRPAIAALANRFRRLGPGATIVRGADRRYTLYTDPADDAPEVTAAWVTLVPDDDVYIVDERALEAIPAEARAALDFNENI